MCVCMWFSVGGSACAVCWGEFVFQLLHQCTGDSRSHKQAAILHGRPSRSVFVSINIIVRTRIQLSLKVRTVWDVFSGPHNFNELFMRSDLV